MQQLDALLKRRIEIEKEMAGFGDLHLGQGIPLRYVELGQRLKSVEEEIVNIRDWYSLSVLESLRNETTILKYLTIALIALTGVLAILAALLASGIRI